MEEAKYPGSKLDGIIPKVNLIGCGQAHIKDIKQKTHERAALTPPFFLVAVRAMTEGCLQCAYSV